ncbi:PfkB family carbohydrate kinase [Kytococcus sedentarius]|uniref:PfkB family carbohydrate kinase n=1 Tax=Kytococcus sedentarius TaxID=1276 RepID=UPI0035BBB941
MTPTGGVLVVGEALIDVVHPADGSAPAEHVGGSPANVAMGLARLGHPTTLVAHLAHDARGERIAAAVGAAGATVDPSSWSAERTSTAEARLDADGAAQYTFDLTWEYDAAAVARTLGGSPASDGPVGHVHTGSLAAVLAPGADALHDHLQELRRTQTVSYDPNARPGVMGSAQHARAQAERFARLADVVKCSDEDLAWLHPGATWQDAARHLADLGPQLVVVTRGGHGASALWRDAAGSPSWLDLEAPRVEGDC